MPWYTVQISHQGEKETSKSLVRAVKSALGKKAETFIPCVRGEGPGYRKEFYLVEGYLFVSYEGETLAPLLALEDEPFFDCVVTIVDDDGRRCPVEMSDADIKEMKSRVREELRNPDDVEEGDWVLVIDGDLRHLHGEVVKVEGDQALVHFAFYSKEKRGRIPLFCLRKAERHDE